MFIWFSGETLTSEERRENWSCCEKWIKRKSVAISFDYLSIVSSKNVKCLLVPASKILNAESLGFGLLVGPKINWLISENENNH